ncbi:MAG: hypothetical protein V8Q54_00565 [Alistipes senegalensis]
MFRALAILVPALLTAACGTRPQTTERKGRIIALTDSVLTAGNTDTVRFGRLGSGEIASCESGWPTTQAVRWPSPPTAAAADARPSNLIPSPLRRETPGK